MYNVYVEIYGESLMLQEYLEEQLLTPIRSKVRQDVGLEEPNSRLRRNWYGPTLDKLREEACENSQLSYYCWSTTLGKCWLTVSGFLSSLARHLCYVGLRPTQCQGRGMQSRPMIRTTCSDARAGRYRQ